MLEHQSCLGFCQLANCIDLVFLQGCLLEQSGKVGRDGCFFFDLGMKGNLLLYTLIMSLK